MLEMTKLPVSSPSTAPIYWMALGTFAIGTESFMIVPLLPKIATNLSVSVSEAGQLVTAFTLALALSSPVLTALTGNFNRRTLLLLSMVVFTLGNIAAWASTDYSQVVSARILLALAAGLYSPNASALAGALVPAEKRGRALSIVNGGMTIAIVLGLPLGAMIGDRLGWRTTFLGVGVLAAMATAGLIFGLRRGVGDHMPVATLRERIEVARRPAVLLALFVTTAWAVGAFTVWTYIAPYLTATAGLDGPQISGVVFLWGVAAAIGIFGGGHLNDKIGSRSVILPTGAPPILLLHAFWFLVIAEIEDDALPSTRIVERHSWGIGVATEDIAGSQRPLTDVGAELVKVRMTCADHWPAVLIRSGHRYGETNRRARGHHVGIGGRGAECSMEIPIMYPLNEFLEAQVGIARVHFEEAKGVGPGRGGFICHRIEPEQRIAVASEIRKIDVSPRKLAIGEGRTFGKGARRVRCVPGVQIGHDGIDPASEVGSDTCVYALAGVNGLHIDPVDSNHVIAVD